MNPTQRAYLQLHISVLLYGFTAILGKLITLSELSLVWWRMGLTTVSFLLMPSIVKAFRTVPPRVRWQLLGIGIVVALHWVCFFGAVKYANVSICLVCMAMTSFMTALFEPLIFRTRIKPYELLLGIAVIPGMYLVVSATSWDMRIGIVLGLLSAALAVVFSVLNKKMVAAEINTKVMTFIELGSGWLFLSAVLPLYLWQSGAAFWPTLPDLGWLLILALLCTTLAFVLTLNALKHISAFTSNLVINLEPVYGILIAWWLFQENKEVGEHFYIGVAIVLLAVFIYPLVKRVAEGGRWDIPRKPKAVR